MKRFKSKASSDSGEPSRTGLSGIFFNRKKEKLNEVENKSQDTEIVNPERDDGQRVRKYDAETYNSLSADVLDDEDMEKIEERFLSCARDGNQTKLSEMLESRRKFPRFDINAQDSASGNTALMWSAIRGNTKILEMLLSAGADITVRNHSGQTVLHLGSPQTLQTIVHSAQQKCSLSSAVWLGDIKMTKKCLRLYDVDEKSPEGLTPLLLAIRDLEMFERLTSQNTLISSPIDVVSELLQRGADVTSRDSSGRTALHYVSASKSNCSVDILHKLILSNTQKGPVEILRGFMNDKQLFIRLASLSAYHEYAIDDTGQSALHYACAVDNLQVVEALLDRHLNANIVDNCGNTPLHLAAQNGHSRTCMLLLKRGADSTLQNSDGLTALDLSRSRQVRSTIRKHAAVESEIQTEMKKYEPISDKNGYNTERTKDVSAISEMTTEEAVDYTGNGGQVTGSVIFSRHSGSSKHSKTSAEKISSSAERLNDVANIRKNLQARTSRRGMAAQPTARSPPGKVRHSRVKFIGTAWRQNSHQSPERETTGRNTGSFLPQLHQPQVQTRSKSSRSRERNVVKLEDLYTEAVSERSRFRSTLSQSSAYPPLHSSADVSCFPGRFSSYPTELSSRSVPDNMSYRSASRTSDSTDELLDIEDDEDVENCANIYRWDQQNLASASPSCRERHTSKATSYAEGDTVDEDGIVLNLSSPSYQKSNIYGRDSSSIAHSNKGSSSSTKIQSLAENTLDNITPSNGDNCEEVKINCEEVKIPESSFIDRDQQDDEICNDVGCFKINGYAKHVSGNNGNCGSRLRSSESQYDHAPERPCTIRVKGKNQASSKQDDEDIRAKASPTTDPAASSGTNKISSSKFLSHSCHSFSSSWQRDSFDEDSVLVAKSLRIERTSDNSDLNNLYPLIPRRISTNLQQEIDTAIKEEHENEFTDIRKMSPGSANSPAITDSQQQSPNEELGDFMPDKLDEAKNHDDISVRKEIINRKEQQTEATAEERTMALLEERDEEFNMDLKTSQTNESLNFSPKRKKSAKSKQRSKSVEGLKSSTRAKDSEFIQESGRTSRKYLKENSSSLQKSKAISQINLFDDADADDVFAEDGTPYFSRNNKASYLRREKSKSSQPIKRNGRISTPLVSKSSTKISLLSKESTKASLNKEKSSKVDNRADKGISESDFKIKNNSKTSRESNIRRRYNLCINNQRNIIEGIETQHQSISAEALTPDEEHLITQTNDTSFDDKKDFLHQSVDELPDRQNESPDDEGLGCAICDDKTSDKNRRPELSDEHTGPVITDLFESQNIDTVKKSAAKVPKHQEKNVKVANRMSGNARARSAKQRETGNNSASKKLPVTTLRSASAKRGGKKAILSKFVDRESAKESKTNGLSPGKSAKSKSKKADKFVSEIENNDSYSDDDITVSENSKLVGGIGWHLDAYSNDNICEDSSIAQKDNKQRDKFMINLKDFQLENHINEEESWKPVSYRSSLDPLKNVKHICNEDLKLGKEIVDKADECAADAREVLDIVNASDDNDQDDSKTKDDGGIRTPLENIKLSNDRHVSFLDDDENRQQKFNESEENEDKNDNNVCDFRDEDNRESDDDCNIKDFKNNNQKQNNEENSNDNFSPNNDNHNDNNHDNDNDNNQEDLRLDLPPLPDVVFRPKSTKSLISEKSPRFVRKHDSYGEKSGRKKSAIRRALLKNLEREDGDDSPYFETGKSRLTVVSGGSSDITERMSSAGTGRLGRTGGELSRAGSVISNLSRSTLDDVDIIQWKRGNMLGKGAYGTVWCGLTNSGELIAVKMIELDTRDMEKAEEEYAQIQQEVEILKTLRHNNVVEYLGTSLEENVVSIFMQYVPGGSIANLLARFGALEEEVFCNYTKQILEGVDYLHDNNVIHRDIKGGNVMLMHNGVIKLIDFGCAKKICWPFPSSRTQDDRIKSGAEQNQSEDIEPQERRAQSALNEKHEQTEQLMNVRSRTEQQMLLKSVRGTPYWMAPEVIREEGHGAPSDIWSVGCTVFEMATKKPPWAAMPVSTAIFAIGSDSTPIPSLPYKFSGDAREFVQACLTRDPLTRPTSTELLSHPFIINPRRTRTKSGTKSSRVLN